MPSPFLIIERALAELNERQQYDQQHILNGAPRSFDEYRYRCGVVQGIESAKIILQGLVDAAKDD